MSAQHSAALLGGSYFRVGQGGPDRGRLPARGGPDLGFPRSPWIWNRPVRHQDLGCPALAGAPNIRLPLEQRSEPLRCGGTTIVPSRPLQMPCWLNGGNVAAGEPTERCLNRWCVAVGRTRRSRREGNLRRPLAHGGAACKLRRGAGLPPLVRQPSQPAEEPPFLQSSSGSIERGVKLAFFRRCFWVQSCLWAAAGLANG